MQIEKVYEPQRFEPHWAQWWIDSGIFRADAGSGRPYFSLVIPPPNVTGSLHMGHMLEHTEIDVTDPLASHARRQHALAARHRSRRHRHPDGGRAPARRRGHQTAATSAARNSKKRVWEWKAQSGDTIKRQMNRARRIAATGRRERFTLDPGLSRAVREVFVRLYEKGLIYRGEYMVNWCPRCHTAISDLEVDARRNAGPPLAHPLSGQRQLDRYLIVATTRPETMLGDTAVAINPKDARYVDLHGKTVQLPLMDREIPIILDDMADPEFGTGVGQGHPRARSRTTSKPASATTCPRSR